MPYHPIIVVGGGLAGLRAAIEATQRGVETAVLSLVHPIRSHSGAAQGGINAALGNAEGGQDDSPEKHAHDTIYGSDYLADQDAVEIMTREAPQRIFELEHWGAPFSRTPQGKIAQRPFGGADFPRTCYAADKTGHYLLHTLYEQALRYQVKVYAEWVALSLVVKEAECRGLVALHLPTGEIQAFQARGVIMATGGAGRIYSRSTNALINTGNGLALAYRAGAPLKDMEFVQFHPTTLYGSNILITEAARGEGGYLVNRLGERFMKNYTPQAMELAPRDIVTRAVFTEINQGRGFEGKYIHLDLRHLGREKILERLPGIRDIAVSFAGIDPILEPLPVQPSQHYTMGGIHTNSWGETDISGLLAAGECACISVHGANRLGGNSLLETVVFGQRAGQRASELVKGKPAPASDNIMGKATEEVTRRLGALVAGRGQEDPSQIREEMQDTMMEKVGIFRHRAPLLEAVDKILEIQERYRKLRPCYEGKKFNWDLVRAFELAGQLQVAEVIARGALAREESRGFHYRTDFPQRDDERWLQHTLAHYTPKGPRFSFQEVTITRWKPEARRY